MLNNRGQSLVLFILIIPILLLIMVLVIDIGRVFNKKNEMDQVAELILDYYLEKQVSHASEDLLDNEDNDKVTQNKEDEDIRKEIEELLKFNLEDVTCEVRIQDETISLVSKTYVKGILTSIIELDGFMIKREYQGYLEGVQKRIEIN